MTPALLDKQVVILGGGPAGLTAAYELSKVNIRSVVLEKDSVVGGLARTVEHHGYRFDIGGHRFFTKVKAVDSLWREVLTAPDFLHRRRLSRIYFNQKFFHYPLRPINALFGSGLCNSSLIFLSYLKAQLFPAKPERTFEQWVVNRFGMRLFQTFFKTYTEKVWGIPCNEISADWAAQRIKGLSLWSVLRNALFPPRSLGTSAIRTLVDAFDYPRLGPGMMWQAVAEFVLQRGHQVRLGASVERIHWSGERVQSVEHQRDGQTEVVLGTDFISSMPIGELCKKLSPAAPAAVLAAAADLKHRDFLTVALIIDRREVFPDNWIYIHDPTVRVGRIQNFKNWSSDMVPDPDKTCLGLEYFCFEGDGLWKMSDEQLIELGAIELEQIGLLQGAAILDGKVVRMPMAYPVYDATYEKNVGVIREFLATLKNLQVVGRNGMHRYNNQDHSMLTAMLAVKNIQGGHHDLFTINAEPEYHEEFGSQVDPGTAALLAATQPLLPQRISAAAPDVNRLPSLT